MSQSFSILDIYVQVNNQYKEKIPKVYQLTNQSDNFYIKNFEKCSIEATELVGDHSVVNIDKCIDCGICAHHCLEKTMNMEKTRLRKVFIPLPKIVENN